MVPLLLGIIALQAVALAGVVMVARELGGLARVALGAREMPPSTSRILQWLMAPKTAPLPSLVHGASPPSPPLNCHVGSLRPAPARPSPSSPIGETG